MKMAVKILSNQFNFLGLIDDYETLIFHRKFYSVGEFELHINIEKKNTELLQKENLVWFNNDKYKVGVILHREINLNEDGLQTLTVKGYTLKGMLSRRLIEPKIDGYDRQEGNQEFIMKQFVYNNTINTSVNRIIPQIAIADNKGLGEFDRWRGRFENLTDKLQEVGEYSGLGWDLMLDIEKEKFIFDVFQGMDLTQRQSSNPPVTFSVDFHNIKGHNYIDSSINHKNLIYAAGQGEEENRLIQQIGNVAGIDRKEEFADLSSAEDINELKAEGQRVLDSLKEIKSFESEIIDFGSFKLGIDYDLGDYVTIQNKKWNLTMDTQIIEIIETIDMDGYNIDLVFGNNIPTILDKMREFEEKQKLKEMAEGKEGVPGKDGTGLEYSWNGTSLGVKREDETIYTYVNLVGKEGPQGKEGKQGPQGIQGLPGIDGKSLEFQWQGTKLGIRLEGQSDYIYVDLKGDKGDQGIQGIQGKQGVKGERGERGLQGIQGKSLEFTWNGTSLGIKREGDTTYQYVDLVGPQGPPGITEWEGITDRPTKLSQFEDDLVIECGGGTTVITSKTEPTGLKTDDYWHKEI